MNSDFYDLFTYFCFRFIAVITLLLSVSATSEPAPRATLAREASIGFALDSSAGIWSRLRFQASNTVASAETAISLTFLNSDDFPDLADLPASRMQPGGPKVLEITVETVFNLPIVGKRRSDITAWFDLGTAAVLQRVNERRGKRPKHKVTRFGSDGLFVSRTRPASSAEHLESPRDWSNREENTVSYSANQKSCDVVTDFMAILLIARRAATDDGAPSAVCVVDNNELFLLVLKKSDVERLEARYLTHIDGSSTEVSGYREIVRVTVRGEAIGPDAGESPEFLGLRGDIDLFFDTRTHIPVRIVGSVPVLGRVSFRLSEVWLQREHTASPAGS